MCCKGCKKCNCVMLKDVPVGDFFYMKGSAYIRTFDVRRVVAVNIENGRPYTGSTSVKVKI